MRVPGGNILNVAFRVIGKATFKHYAFVSRNTVANGQWLSIYANPVTLSGSAQPPPRELFERYGLDFQSNYMVFYVSKRLLDVTRDVSGDQIEFNGLRWQVITKTDWLGIDGWIGLVSVQVEQPPC